MAERHWEELRPSAASRHDLEPTGEHDRKLAGRPRRRPRHRIRRQLRTAPPARQRPSHTY